MKKSWRKAVWLYHDLSPWRRIVAYPFFIFFKLLKYAHTGSKQPAPDIWLIGESHGHCQPDNGFYFFRYCRRHKPQKKVYFVTQEKTLPTIDEDEELNIVTYGSVRHIFLYVNAKILLYTHTYSDVIFRELFHCGRSQKKLVYLHHSTLGFKKFDRRYLTERNLMDIFTVGSNMERDILVEQIGVEAKRLVVTGYARYDILHNTCSAPPIHIAYMPTHRDWLHEGAHAFKESDFHHQLVRFLSSPTLHNLLHHANAHLKVRLHPANMAFTQMISDNHPRITFVRNQDATPLELIRESHILITDYSGVAFDFIYLNKPVIFYRFDAQRYISERGSYIDLEDTRFGDIYTEPEPLIQGLHHIIDNGCTLDTTRHTWRQCVMPHLDQGNCHRIYQAINEKWPRHHRN